MSGQPVSVETDDPRREIATRVETLIRGAGRTLENVAREALGQEGGILSSRPTAIWADLLPGRRDGRQYRRRRHQFLWNFRLALRGLQPASQ